MKKFNPSKETLLALQQLVYNSGRKFKYYLRLLHSSLDSDIHFYSNILVQRGIHRDDVNLICAIPKSQIEKISRSFIREKLREF